MILLTPAYGRDYKSKAAVIEDFEAGRDFIFHDPTSPLRSQPRIRYKIPVLNLREANAP